MDLPVTETSIRATSKRKPRKCLQGIGEKEPGLYYCMQPRKWQVAFYHVIKLMEWITALTALIHLSAVGAFTGDEWYSPLQPTLSSCCVFLQSLSCYCSLESAVADALNSLFSLPHIWTSDHQLHLSLVLYSLPEMPAEPFMSSRSLKSASCTPGCRCKPLLQLSEKGEWDMASSHYPPDQDVTSHMVLRLDMSSSQTNHFFKDEHDD